MQQRSCNCQHCTQIAVPSHVGLTNVPPPCLPPANRHLPPAAGPQPKPVRIYLSPATAVFMPSPLIEQWELQLRQHTDAQLRVRVYPQDCECSAHSTAACQCQSSLEPH